MKYKNDYDSIYYFKLYKVGNYDTFDDTDTNESEIYDTKSVSYVELICKLASAILGFLKRLIIKRQKQKFC